MQGQLSFGTRIKKRLKSAAEKKKLIAGIFVLGLILGAAISFILPKKFRATSNIYFKYNSVNSTFLSNNGSLANELNYLKSVDLLDIVSDKLENHGFIVSVSELSESGEVLEDKSATMIELNVISEKGEKAAAIANSVVESFSQKTTLDSRGAFINLMRAVTERDKALQADMRREIANQQRTQSISLSIDQEQLISQIAEFESELEKIELENQFYSNQVSSLQKMMEEDYSDVSSDIMFFNNPELLELRTKLERLETQSNIAGVASKLNNFSIIYDWEEYRLADLNSVRRLFNQGLVSLIENLTKNKDIDDTDFLKILSEKYFENQIKINSIDLTKSIIFNTLNQLEGRFNLIPFSIIDMARQIRIQKFNNRLSLKIKAKIQNLKQIEKDFFAEIESIRKATAPRTYFSPNTTVNTIIGGIIGLIIGFFSAFSSNKKKIDLITKSYDLKEAGFKMISQIPSFPAGTPLLFDSLNQTGQKKLDPRIINSFNNIETFLKYGTLDKSLQTIMFLSGEDGEGKSLVASNTATTLANNGNSVLLIDADLKQPQLNKYFKIKSTPSLAHYLFRKKELEDIIRKTHNPNLDIITCIEFPQNPSVIITSERMKNFMEVVKGKYDYIIYDTCSLSSLKETAEIAKDIDEVILVARSNKTKLSELVSTEALLNENGVLNFNLVLNDVKL